MNDVPVHSPYKCVRRQAIEHLLTFRRIGRLDDKAGGGQIILMLGHNLALGLTRSYRNRRTNPENYEGSELASLTRHFATPCAVFQSIAANSFNFSLTYNT